MATRRFVLAGVSSVAATSLVAGPAALARRRKASAEHQKEVADASVPSTPAETPAGPLDTVARWAFITDAPAGSVLLEKAADQPMPPSSLTKLMTAYLVFTALAEGRLRMDQTLPVSERAWRMQGSKMFVPLGAQVAVEDLIRGMLIQSGNDACIVLAEDIAGSEEQFVVQMNQEAARLGLTHSQFRNATGWPDPDHHMSARDIATLASHLIADYPQYYHFFSEKSYKFNNITQDNRNVLVDEGLADGLKTGHTDAGGFGLCASALRDGRRVILVLNGLPSARSRAEEGERLLGWAFATFESVHVFTRNQVVRTVPVWLGERPDVPVAAGADLVLTLPRGWREHTQIRADFQSPIPAPVSAGQTVGKLVLARPNAPDQAVPLIAMADVKGLALPKRAIAVLEHKIGGG